MVRRAGKCRQPNDQQVSLLGARHSSGASSHDHVRHSRRRLLRLGGALPAMSRRLLFLLPLATLALMAGFFAWSLMAGRDPASIGSVMVGRPAPKLDVR